MGKWRKPSTEENTIALQGEFLLLITSMLVYAN